MVQILEIMFSCLCRKLPSKTHLKSRPELKSKESLDPISIHKKQASNLQILSEKSEHQGKKTLGKLDPQDSFIQFQAQSLKQGQTNHRMGNTKLPENKVNELSVEASQSSGDDDEQVLKSISQIMEIDMNEDFEVGPDQETNMAQVLKFVYEFTQNSILEDKDFFLVDQSQYKAQLHEQINLFLNEITDRIIGDKKTKIQFQPLAGFHHFPQESGIDHENYKLIMEQIQAGSMMNAFTRAMIDLDYARALIFFASLSEQQKCRVDEKGISVLKLVTLNVIKNNGNAEAMKFFRHILKDQIISGTFLNKNSFMYGDFYKPIEEAIIYRNIPALAHLFQSSYDARIDQIKKKLGHFVSFLGQIEDFILQIDAKAGSLIPLIGKIIPDDHFIIIKTGSYLRADYSLIGHRGLKPKRRKMSCIIGNFDIGSGQIGPYILAVNHQHKTFTNLLQQINKQEIALIIEDLLSTQLKRGSPIVLESRVKKSLDIFNNPIHQDIYGCPSQKCWLKIKYESHTQKIMPGSLNKNDHLQFLNSFKQYQIYSPPKKQTKIKSKELNLGLWIPQSFPIKFEHFLEIMSYFSIASQTGKLIFDFLKQNTIAKQIKQVPTRIQIPINFTFYLQLTVTNVQKVIEESVEVDFTKKFKRVSRSQYQKTLERQQKRLLLAKLYL